MSQTLDLGSSSTSRESFTLEEKYSAEEGLIYLTGLQALLRVLLDQRRSDARQGLNVGGFVSGYPGPPVGGLDLELQRNRRLLEANNIIQVAGLNEDLAATAIFGSQVVDRLAGSRVDGVFGMWVGKAPGVARTGAACRDANYRGVSRHGGVLAVAGDDPDTKSTILPSDSNSAFYDWYMPILFPGDVQDVVDLGLHGYALSRASGLWTGLKMVANVADAAGTAVVSPDRIHPTIPSVMLDHKPFEPVGRLNQAGRGMLEAERELFYGQLEIARAYGRENGLNRTVVDPADARIGIIAPDKAYFDPRQAFDRRGLDREALLRLGIRLFKVGLLFPLDPSSLREFARGLSQIIVVEETRPF